LIGALYSVLFAALLLRVIGSWFGLFRYSRWMRPAYAVTDWLVEPIRRLLPPMGALDWSPLVAWLVLWLLKQLLLNVVLLCARPESCRRGPVARRSRGCGPARGHQRG